MAKGTLLTNPDLDLPGRALVLSETGSLGARAARPVANGSNSGKTRLDALGDPGDTSQHTFKILGSASMPQYAPDAKYAGVVTSAALAHNVIGGDAVPKHELVSVRDQLYMILGNNFALTASDTVSVDRWDGSAFSEVGAPLSAPMVAMSACGFGDLIDIVTQFPGALGDSVLYPWRFNPVTSRLQPMGSAVLNLGPSIQDMRLASNGVGYVLALQQSSVSTPFRDVKILTGTSLLTMKQNPDTLHGLFGTAWGDDGYIQYPALQWSPIYGYVIAVKARDDSSSKIRLARSWDGVRWVEFTDAAGQVSQPPALGARVAGSASGLRVIALNVEGRRVYVYYLAAATENGTPNNVQMFYFDGISAWSSNTDFDGGETLPSTSTIMDFTACSWRGRMFYSWFSTAAVGAVVRYHNDLTASDTGFRRELIPGVPMFVAATAFDDQRKALTAAAFGPFMLNDEWTIGLEYARGAKYVLSESLDERWEATHNVANQNGVFDCGDPLVFDSLGLFGLNVPTFRFQANASSDFTSPTFNQLLSAVVSSHTIGAGTGGNVIKPATAPAWKRHRFARSPFWAKCSTGIFRILENTEDALIVSGSVGSPTGTLEIFGDRIGYFHGSVVAFRYFRVLHPDAISVPDAKYHVGRLIAGLKLELDPEAMQGFTDTGEEIISTVETHNGTRFVTPLSLFPRESSKLSFRGDTPASMDSLRGIFARGRGGQFAYWPEGSDEPNNVFLTRIASDLIVRDLRGGNRQADLSLGGETH